MPPRPEHLLRQKHLRDQFERVLEQLRLELQLKSARRHLDHLTDHLGTLLMGMDCTLEREAMRLQLDAAHRAIANRDTKPELRVVR